MKPDLVELLKTKICGKKIVSVEPSGWSGEVKSLMKNQGCVSISLDKGTALEAEGLDPLHPGEKPSGFFYR